MKIEITNDDGTVHVIEPKHYGFQKVLKNGKEARIIVYSDDKDAFEATKPYAAKDTAYATWIDDKGEIQAAC